MILSQVQRRVRSIDGALKSKISSSHPAHWELVLPQGDAEQEGGGELLVEKDVEDDDDDDDDDEDDDEEEEDEEEKVEKDEEEEAQQKMCLCFLVKSALFISL